jgi:pyruvyltransferase
MKNKITVKWAKSEDENIFNFGDDVGPYIVGKLSGLEVENIYFPHNRLKSIIQLGKFIYRGKFSLNLASSFFKSFFTKEYILTCGSILQWYSSSRAIIWGAGIIDNNVELISAKKYLAVRGKYSEEKIKKFNLKEPVVYGDPALLLPRIYIPKIENKYRVGIIAHYIHYEDFKKLNLPDDILLIKLNSPSVEEVVDDICSCEYTISTSLHGIIVSHAFNIKSLWYEVKNKPLSGDNIKFFDYFSSVDIPNYEPFSFEDSFDACSIVNNLVSNDKINHPKLDLNIIQNKLINCAPFKVKSKYTCL